MKATNNTTAGKTAKKCAAWHMITRKGRAILRSPDSKEYCGTAQEVRDAVLMPWERDSLTQHLRVVRHIARTRDEVATLAASARRDSMELSLCGAERAVFIPADLAIQARGAARVLGYDTPKQWIAEVIRTAIAGCAQISMTRHERAALAAIS